MCIIASWGTVPFFLSLCLSSSLFPLFLPPPLLFTCAAFLLLTLSLRPHALSPTSTQLKRPLTHPPILTSPPRVPITTNDSIRGTSLPSPHSPPAYIRQYLISNATPLIHLTFLVNSLSFMVFAWARFYNSSSPRYWVCWNPTSSRLSSG